MLRNPAIPGRVAVRTLTQLRIGLSYSTRLSLLKARRIEFSMADISYPIAPHVRQEFDANYRELLDSIDQGFCIIEVLFDAHARPTDYVFLHVNRAFERHSGLADAEGRRMRELRPEHEEYWYEMFGEIALTGNRLRVEKSAHALGDRWFEIDAFRVGAPEQHRVAILFKDISERKKADLRIASNQSQLQLLFEGMPLGVLLIDQEFRLVRANAIARAALGNSEMLMGLPFDVSARLLWPTSVADEIVARFRHTLSTGEPYVVPEMIQERRDRGIIEYYEWRISRVLLPKRTFGVLCYFQDISAQVKSRHALLEADRRKDEFLATLAHELRNPLAALGAAAQLLAKASDRPSVAAMAREALQRQVQHMARLLDDLLDVARITRGRLELRMGIVDIESIIETAIETARPAIEQKEHHFNVTFPEEDAVALVNADPVRLSQVIANLLTNAAKYTDNGGSITLTVEAKPEKVLIRVRDDGMGIEPEALQKIFGMFAQEQTALERSEGGLGIGLALASGLMRLHAGTITAYSEGLGKGSEFIVCLPRVAAESHRPAPHAVEHEQRSERRHTILIADDNKDAADHLAMLLRDEDHAVIVAYDGVEAVAAANAHHPDVVVLDIGMPRKNGYDTARDVRAEEWAHDTKLIAISGWGRREDRERAFAAGFDEHLTKPIDIDTLARLVTSKRRPTADSLAHGAR